MKCTRCHSKAKKVLDVGIHTVYGRQENTRYKIALCEFCTITVIGCLLNTCTVDEQNHILKRNGEEIDESKGAGITIEDGNGRRTNKET